MTDDVAVSTEIQVDDETRAALLLFNERVEASAAKERGAKRVAKAERLKDEAAATVRKLSDNPNASAEDKATAETAYKEALESYNTIRDNPLAGDQPKKTKASADDAPAEASADDAPTETSADEEHPPEPPAEVAATTTPVPATEASDESE